MTSRTILQATLLASLLSTSALAGGVNHTPSTQTTPAPAAAPLSSPTPTVAPTVSTATNGGATTTPTARASASSSGGSSSSRSSGGSGGSLSISGAGIGNNNAQAAARAPDVFVPGGGGMDCPTVGFGASGAGITGGGGFGPSWISTDCNKRKVVEMLARYFDNTTAQAYAIANIDGIKEAVAAATPAKSVSTSVATTRPAYCNGMASWEVKHYPQCK